jgi:glycosyltransferase involved in cell wall biosynthesis
MRIGVNTLFMIPGKVGGSETYLRETLRAIMADHPDVDLVLFTNNENHELLKDMFDSVTRAECRKLNFRAENRFVRVVREQIQLPRLVRQYNVDLLWSPGYTSPLFCPCPQVVTIHDMQYKQHPEDLTPTARFALNILVRMSARPCNTVITDSEFAKQQILQHTSAPDQRITVIQPGVNTRFCPAGPASDLQERVKSIIKSDRPYLLFVGNTYPHKNVHMLAQAFGTILNDIPHSLVIVGTPDRGEELLKRALTDLDDPSRLIRLSYQSEEDLATLYAAADLFVFPSLYEGFGLPVLESMMAGTPVLTTRCASIPEVAGDCARYFEETKHEALAKAIREMLAMTPEERDNWIKRAKARAEQFTWQRTARETVDVFRSVLERE